MADEAHLRDGTIIDLETGEIMEPETGDYRLEAARNFLATAPESDFTRLLSGVVDVARDFIATDPAENVTKVVAGGGVYIAPADYLRLCDDCKIRLVLETTA
jgi:hypothetical protein